MSGQNLFSRGFPTNRIPVTLPSSGRFIILRETTVTELKSLAKTIIDNLGRKQMDVLYDAVTDYLQSMVLTEGVDVREFTEFDRLFCLMVFFQMSFYREPISYNCPHCGVEIVYRYDMSKYLAKMPDAYVDEQVVEIPYKSKTYRFRLGWPKVPHISRLMHHFYGGRTEVTEEMERTQYGINFVFAFIRNIEVSRTIDGQPEVSVDMDTLETWDDVMECVNALPSMVVFDEEDGLFAKVMGMFVNRLENCFQSESCPQCHKDTYYGLSQSSLFYGMFYGSLKSIYGFILQVECLLVHRYDCCLFDKENYLTYNDLQSLVKQIGSTAEKENKERQKMGKDNFVKGLWYIREILNSMVFPEDKRK